MDNNNMKDKKYITVLDFEEGRVYQYELEGELKEDEYGFCPYEMFMDNKGHRVGNCQWMVHDIGELVDTKTSYGRLNEIK